MDQTDRHDPDRLQRRFPTRRRLAMRLLRVVFPLLLPGEKPWPKVSECHVKHLLRVLWDHADKGNTCWLKLQTIADEMQTSTRTVESAIAAAVRLGFIATDSWNRYTKATTYVILWSNIFDYVFGPTEDDSADEPSATVADGLTPNDPQQLRMVENPPATVADGSGQTIRNSCGWIELHIRNEDFKEVGEEKEPPPSEVTNAPPVGVEDLREAWRQVELSAGEFVADLKCISAARDRGCTPAEVRALIDYARANWSQWQSPAGALHTRIRSAIPGEAPDRRWPPARTATQNNHRASVEHRQNAQEAAESERRLRQQGIERRELERAHGPSLDALTPVERDQLAALALQVGSPAHRLYRSNPAAELVRGKLLRALRDRAALSTKGPDDGT